MHVLYNTLNTHISENHSFHTFLIVDDTKYSPHRNKTYGDTFCLKSKQKRSGIFQPPSPSNNSVITSATHHKLEYNDDSNHNYHLVICLDI